MISQRLVLASSSDRRRDLLARLGLEFDIVSPDVDESPFDDEDPVEYVRRVALAKLSSVRGPRFHSVDAVVVAADTVVVLDGEILGKPRDPDDALRMLARMAGRSHEVVTAVAVGFGTSGPSTVESESTTVHVDELPEPRLAWYVDSGEGVDKAGGYAIQGAGGLFADRVEGSVSNVIGLPLPLLEKLCAAVGVDLLGFRGTR